MTSIWATLLVACSVLAPGHGRHIKANDALDIFSAIKTSSLEIVEEEETKSPTVVISVEGVDSNVPPMVSVDDADTINIHLKIELISDAREDCEEEQEEEEREEEEEEQIEGEEEAEEEEEEEEGSREDDYTELHQFPINNGTMSRNDTNTPADPGSPPSPATPPNNSLELRPEDYPDFSRLLQSSGNSGDGDPPGGFLMNLGEGRGAMDGEMANGTAGENTNSSKEDSPTQDSTTQDNRPAPLRIIQNSSVTSMGSISLSINLCYFCDERCKQDILSSGYMGAYHFFNDLTAIITTELNSLNGYFFTVFNLIILEPGINVEGRWYLTNYDDPKAMLNSVNTNFWGTTNLWQAGLAFGCDAGINAVSESDGLWSDQFCGSMDGIANMFQICNSMSYATVKLVRNLPKMATLMAHELGHLLGMYHDGDLDAAYTNYEGWFLGTPQVADLYTALRGNCTIVSHECINGQYQCIMNGYVNTQAVFSKCSKCYFDMFFALAVFWPNDYMTACMPPPP